MNSGLFRDECSLGAVGRQVNPDACTPAHSHCTVATWRPPQRRASWTMQQPPGRLGPPLTGAGALAPRLLVGSSRAQRGVHSKPPHLAALGQHGLDVCQKGREQGENQRGGSSVARTRALRRHWWPGRQASRDATNQQQAGQVAALTAAAVVGEDHGLGAAGAALCALLLLGCTPGRRWGGGAAGHVSPRPAAGLGHNAQLCFLSRTCSQQRVLPEVEPPACPPSWCQHPPNMRMEGSRITPSLSNMNCSGIWSGVLSLSCSCRARAKQGGACQAGRMGGWAGRRTADTLDTL